MCSGETTAVQKNVVHNLPPTSSRKRESAGDAEGSGHEPLETKCGIIQNMKPLPNAVKASLWSYDTGALDAERDKELILFNIMNYGGDEAARWACATYTQEDMAYAVEHSPKSAWSRKSLAFWTAVLHAHPERAVRVL